jgi:BirA family biotin operon repressor/biotin-[acetyl-CoA-carboxylase] ligase
VAAGAEDRADGPDGGVAPTGRWSTHARASVVQDALAGCALVGPLHAVDRVGSTQDAALELAAEGAETGTIVLADRQLSGRGRAGRRWDDDPRGGTLAMTLLLDASDLTAQPLTLVPHALGMALVDAGAALRSGAVALRLKWPNDVVVRDVTGSLRKLAGILVERVEVRGPDGPRDVLLCGIGIDVDLPGGTTPLDRTCLTTLTGRPVDRPGLLGALVRALDAALREVRDAPASLLERYRSASDTIGRTIRVELPGGAAVRGDACGIDADGRLLVSSGERIHAILSGTVRDLEESA